MESKITVEEISPEAAAELPLVKETISGNVSLEAIDFQKALESGTMLVKSVSTGDVKTITFKDKIRECRNVSPSDLEVRNGNLVSRQNPKNFKRG